MQELRDSFAELIGPRVLALSPAGQRVDGSDQGLATVDVRLRASDDAAAGGGRDRADRRPGGVTGAGRLAPAVDQIALLDDEATVVATEWLRNASTRLECR